VRDTAKELALCAKNLDIAPATVRGYVEEFFSAERMVDDYIELFSAIIKDNAISDSISQVA
jgi:hypothetical protein